MTARYLSEWWADSHHRALGHTDDTTRRLAIVLGAVRSIVRIVDRSRPPMVVDWATEGAEGEEGMSYTDFARHQLRINPDPVIQGLMEPGAALDVCTGFGLHEASHAAESRDAYDVLTAGRNDPVPAFQPMRVAAYIWNVAEDQRVEGVTSGKWPGFAPYFGALIDWLFGRFQMRHPEMLEYGPSVESKCTFLFAACRFPGRQVAFSPNDQGEVDWWRAWQDDYHEGRVDVAQTIQAGLDHLAEDEATAHRMAEMAEGEAVAQRRGEELRDLIRRLIEEGIDGAPETCPGRFDGELLPTDVSERVKQMVRESLEEHATIVPYEGMIDMPIVVTRPEETADSVTSYVGRASAEAEALRSALVFRASAPQWDEKLLRQGTIDDEELYRIAEDDDRVYSQRIIENKPDAYLGLLVDLSGSMYGEKLRIAQHLAQLFVWGIHDQENVETAVWGHTADVEGEETANVYRIWEPGDSLTRLGLIATLPHADNADGHAISYVVSRMAEHPQPQKVLFVLADGQPSAYNYGGSEAFSHVRAVCRWAEARGVKVIQIAIDPRGIRPADQEAMFGPGNWIGFTDYASLPRQLTALMARFS